MRLQRLIALIFIAAGSLFSPSAWAQTSIAQEANTELQSGNLETAASMAGKACNAGDVDSCALSGMILLQPNYPVFNEVIARTHLWKACNGDHDQSCAVLADMMLKGKGGPVDKPGALKRIKALCENGHPQACPVAEKVAKEVAADEEAARNRVVNLRPKTVTFLEGLEKNLRKNCSAADVATKRQGAAVMLTCSKTVGDLTQAPYRLPKEASDKKKAVAHQAAGMANVARAELYQSLLDKGILGQDKSSMPCNSMQSARANMYFVDILERSNVSEIYGRLKARYETEKAKCD